MFWTLNLAIVCVQVALRKTKNDDFAALLILTCPSDDADASMVSRTHLVHPLLFQGKTHRVVEDPFEETVLVAWCCGYLTSEKPGFVQKRREIDLVTRTGFDGRIWRRRGKQRSGQNATSPGLLP